MTVGASIIHLYNSKVVPFCMYFQLHFRTTILAEIGSRNKLPNKDITSVNFPENKQIVHAPQIEVTCPSLKNEYEAKMAKLKQDLETCRNPQSIGKNLCG